MQKKNPQTVSIYWEASIFIFDNGVWHGFLFSEKWCVYLGIKNLIFNRPALPLSVRKMSRRIV